MYSPTYLVPLVRVTFTCSFISSEMDRKKETKKMRMIMIKLTHRVPISLVEPNVYHDSVCFTRSEDFTWRVSDCEELVAPHECNNYVPKKVF